MYTHSTDPTHYNNDPAQYAAPSNHPAQGEGQDAWATAYRFNSIPQTNSLQYHLQIGSMVINECYGGSIDAWRQQGSRCRKFKELSKSPSLNVTRIMLSRAVRIYAIYYTYGGDQRWPNLSVSHYRAVHSLPEAEQVDLLDAAQNERWTSTQLDAAVSSIHARTSKPRPGRRARHPLVKGLDRADKILEAEFERMERDAVAQGDHATAAKARQMWAQLRQELVELVQNPQPVRSTPHHNGGERPAPEAMDRGPGPVAHHEMGHDMHAGVAPGMQAPPVMHGMAPARRNETMAYAPVHANLC